ncbi:MAG: RnfABCDGE type electron transport complex subunit B [Candidatus Porifericomitaceae bacterium WSBS_2022_MAG_OTU9]
MSVAASSVLRVLEDAIDAELPQTQCGRCGYNGCRPYAGAIAVGAADINRCSPGGGETISVLAELTGREIIALAPDVQLAPDANMKAVVREEDCIGCTRCIQACPVDAIIGAQGQMHSILPAACTACELCLPVCPTDCIVIEAMPPKVDKICG